MDSVSTILSYVGTGVGLLYIVFIVLPGRRVSLAAIATALAGITSGLYIGRAALDPTVLRWVLVVVWIVIAAAAAWVTWSRAETAVLKSQRERLYR